MSLDPHDLESRPEFVLSLAEVLVLCLTIRLKLENLRDKTLVTRTLVILVISLAAAGVVAGAVTAAAAAEPQHPSN